MLPLKMITRAHSGLRIFVGRHRCLSSVPIKDQVHNNNSYSSLIYQLPAVTAVALLSRMKVYQTAVLTTTSAVSLVLNQMDIITTSSLHAVIYMGVAFCVPVYTLGIFCNKVVGKMYISDDKKTLKIGYINFWGRRENVIMEVEDIVPFSEMNAKPNDLYFNIERYSNKSSFKLSLNYGRIENEELFVKIFGVI